MQNGDTESLSFDFQQNFAFLSTYLSVKFTTCNNCGNVIFVCILHWKKGKKGVLCLCGQNFKDIKVL
jgi:hypothetical protein